MSYVPIGDSAGGDPFVTYGRNAAALITKTVKKLPLSQRKPVLRATLDAIDPSLWGTIADKAVEYRKAGNSAAVSMQKAMAASFANGALTEVIRIGKNQRPGPLMHLGLGDDASAGIRHGQFTIDGQTVSVTVYPNGEIKGSKIWQMQPEATSGEKGGWGPIPGTHLGGDDGFLQKKLPKTIVDAFNKKIAVGAIPGMINMSGGYMSGRYPVLKIMDGNGIYLKFDKGYDYQLSDVRQVVMSIHKIPPTDSLLDVIVKTAVWPIKIQFDIAAKAVKAVAPAVSGLLDNLGSAACTLLNHPGASFAAAAGGAVAGGTAGAQAGMTGANVAQAACAPGTPAPPPPPPPTPLPILPIALIGGGVLLLVALASGRKTSAPVKAP